MSTDTREIVLENVKRGFSVSYKKLTVADISDVQQVIKRKYQVHCDHANVKFTQLYSDPVVAVNKFMELYRKVRYNK